MKSLVSNAKRFMGFGGGVERIDFGAVYFRA